MKGISTKFQTFILLCPICLVLSTVFAEDKTLALGVDLAKYLWFCRALIATSVISLLVYCWRRNKIKIFLVDITLVSVVSFILAVNYFIFWNSISVKWVVLLQILFLYVFLRSVLQDKTLRFYMLIFFIFIGFIEAILGISQQYGFIPSNHNIFLLTGSFFNPGPYAGYLAMVSPLTLFYMLKDQVVFKRMFTSRYLPFYLRFTVSLLTFVGIVLVLPATMSRAAWIATVVGCGIVTSCLFLQKSSIKSYLVHQWKKGAILLPVALFLIIVSLVGIYQLKKNSADGRLLIWKISMQVIAKHPFGVGLGHFPNAYGQEQAAYFASGHASAQEEFVAGSPEYAFNEYLQMCIEFGMVVSVVLLVSFIILVYMGIKRKAVAVTGGFISLLVFSSMSYPFSLLPFLIVLVFFIVMILSESGKVKNNNFTEKGILLSWKIAIPILSICCILVIITLNRQYPTFKAYKQWNILRMYDNGAAIPSANKDYEKLYPYLADQFHFLFDYGQNLSKCGEYKMSNKLLEQATRLSCDPMLYNIMGNNYQKMGKFYEAEQQFLKASHLVPNRVFPYFLLANLYYEYKEPEKFMGMAKKVLEKEPKVQSTAIEEMRAKMEELIKKLYKLDSID